MKNFKSWIAFFEDYKGTRGDVEFHAKNLALAKEMTGRRARQAQEYVDYFDGVSKKTEGMRKSLRKMPGFKIVDFLDPNKRGYDNSELLTTFTKDFATKNLYITSDTSNDMRVSEIVYGWSWSEYEKEDYYHVSLIAKVGNERHGMWFQKNFKRERNMYQYVNYLLDLETESRRDNVYLNAKEENFIII
jgi:hypothetical protein